MSVFLNFCDDDTGKSFTAHLNKALLDLGIATFFFSPTQEQPSGIHRGIDDCEVFIAVFSPNYASSFICLDQLSYLLSLPERRLILPVFYYVEPAHVRWQKGPFHGAFEDHKNKNGFDEVKLHKWRNGLKEVTELSGWDMKNYRTEANLVDELVKHVSDKLKYITQLHVANYPIGLDSRVADVMRLLDLHADDVRMIAIHGMGGIGKTTVAKAVFNIIHSSFDASCFLSDVREASRTYGGLVALQKQLLKELFNEDGLNIYDDERGIKIIKNRIGSKKVLVILDDVGHHKQLEKLAGERDWYCKGSRIIITTRDEHVLNVRNRVVNHHIYKLEGLDDTQSLELFSWCAFGEVQPVQEYVKLSKEVVSMAGGLPLALEVLGNYLCDLTSIEEWKDAVAKLKRIPEDDVMLKLKISYDDLNEKEQQIFLDIVCFFIGENKDYAIDIWKCCGFPALISIRRLLQRSLIKIVDGHELWMHDQIRDMGRWIVELENLDDPGSRSRLWDPDEVFDVLKNHKGTSKVRGFMHDGYEWEQSWETEAFKPMTNLKLLSINQASLIGNFKYLSSELVWLQWQGCRLQHLSDDFSHEKLAVLDLSYSDDIVDLLNNNIKELFPKLKVLDLSCCYNLERIPNCSLYPNLEKLILEDCLKLVDIPDSIGLLGKLVYLNLRGCSSLKELPDSIGSLVNLEELDVGGCKELSRLPASMGRMRSLRYVDLWQTAIAMLPDEFGLLPNLEKLNMRGCGQLKELPESIGRLTSLKTLDIGYNSSLTRLPTSLSALCSLEKLDASNCNLQGMIPEDFERLSSLKTLHLSGINFQGLPSSMMGFSQLEALSVHNFEQLVAIPELPSNLKHLDAFQCQSLQTMPKLSHLSKLVSLSVVECGGLVAIQDVPSTLEILNSSNCISLQIIPNLSQLSQLQVLDLTNCNKLVEIQGLSCLKSLRILHLNGCNPHALRGQTLAKETFRSLEKLSIPGSKVPDWFMCHNLSCTLPRLSDVNLHIKEVLLCFVCSPDDTAPNNPYLKLLIKRECEVQQTLSFGLNPLLHQNQMYFYRFRDGDLSEENSWKDGDQIELVCSSIVCLKGGIHLVYKPEDTEDSMQERLADFFNTLLTE
ncbi:hypothetical protein AMTRI_Chr10g224920 [Amborella trichopoda]